MKIPKEYEKRNRKNWIDIQLRAWVGDQIVNRQIKVPNYDAILKLMENNPEAMIIIL